VEHLREIQRAAERSANLTSRLLAFARKQTISPETLDLNEIVAGMDKMLRRLVGERIAFNWSPGADLWRTRIDPSQVDQILVNLVINARDAIEYSGMITIETHNVTLDAAYCAQHLGFTVGEYVQLVVIDTGIGMDAETQAHVFEPFFTTKSRDKGTGLGLAMVYGIVQQNNGYINVYSEIGHGTTFRIYLPRDNTSATRAAPLATEAADVRGTETVLLAEDEEEILRLARTILEQHGYRVLAACTPEEIIRIATEYAGTIHLLVTDVVLSGINGRALRDRVMEYRPVIKCLFMSGYTADVIAHSGVLEEGVSFLQKPFGVSSLLRKVRDVLDDEP
jgi:two-component system, cell cycle sensor histidine kinase and response regulator CckA